jgi:hypothetical protein
VPRAGFQTQLLEVKQAKYESDEQRKRLQMGTHTTAAPPLLLLVKRFVAAADVRCFVVCLWVVRGALLGG